jgi:hypothetical protein
LRVGKSSVRKGYKIREITFKIGIKKHFPEKKSKKKKTAVYFVLHAPLKKYNFLDLHAVYVLAKYIQNFNSNNLSEMT